MSDKRCPSTHIHTVTYLARITGVQCKYTEGHDGPHCGYTGYNDGDVTWEASADNKTLCQAEPHQGGDREPENSRPGEAPGNSGCLCYCHDIAAAAGPGTTGGGT